MILIGIGANLPGPYASTRDACETALQLLEKEGVKVLARSHWYETAPVPVSDQPWYVNGVAAVETDLPPEAVLLLLHQVEAHMGRVRKTRNEARVIDLDLLAYGGLVQKGPPSLPHPRLAERAFVLLPIRDLDPHWHHPQTGASVADLIAALPPGQEIRRI